MSIKNHDRDITMNYQATNSQIRFHPILKKIINLFKNDSYCFKTFPFNSKLSCFVWWLRKWKTAYIQLKISIRARILIMNEMTRSFNLIAFVLIFDRTIKQSLSKWLDFDYDHLIVQSKIKTKVKVFTVVVLTIHGYILFNWSC